MKKGLLVVDVQNDFFENGALEVPCSNTIISYINSLIDSDNYDKIIFSQDFHPLNHISFAENHQGKNIGEFIKLPNNQDQILWPTHCVQNTTGAEFHNEIRIPKGAKIVKKGLDRMVDSYSAFYDNNREVSTGLKGYLSSKKITHLEIVGLALDYCVKFSAIDSQREGFITSVHYKGTKAVNIEPNDDEKTLIELIKNNVNIIS